MSKEDIDKRLSAQGDEELILRLTKELALLKFQKDRIIDDFKSALRKEIEVELSYLKPGDLTEYGDGKMRALKNVLILLDSVTPPKQ